MKGFFREFKTFAIRGNAFELAVGVVIGAAFQKIVSSLVDSVIVPLSGLALGGVDLRDLSVEFGAATLAYGVFIQSVVDFTIIAFVIFLVVKGINSLRKREDAKAAKAPPEEVVLLREIRDALKK